MSGNKFFKAFLIFLSKALSFLPRKVSLYFGKTFANIIYSIYLLSKHKKLLFNNIKLALPVSDNIAKNIAKNHIIKFTKNIVDFMRFEKKQVEKLLDIVDIKGIEHFNEAEKMNKGIILVSAHYGCWELLGAIIRLKFKRTLNVLVQRPSNPIIDELFYKYREKVGVTTYYNDEGKTTLMNVLTALGNNQCVGFIIDQHGESEKTFVEFFGKFVSIPSGFAHFAIKTKAPILPVFIKRKKNDIHEIKFYPIIEVKEDEDKDREIHRISQQTYKLIEKVIKDEPDEWLWSYNRWDKLSLDALEIVNSMKKLREVSNK